MKSLNASSSASLSAGVTAVVCYGCGAEASMWQTGEQPYCGRCWEEITALREMARSDEDRRRNRQVSSWLKHEARCARFRRVANI